MVPSDTDYRIYRDFGHIPGLDIAYMSNGYIYHTKWDDMAQIPAGCLQRGGDNILGLLRNLLNSSFVEDPGEYKFGKVVFFDFVGLFMISYSEQAGLVLNCGFGLAAVVAICRKILRGRLGRRDPNSGDDLSAPVGTDYIILLFKHLGIFLLASAAALSAPLIVGALLSGRAFPITWAVGKSLYRPMSWYATPVNVVGLFLLPSLAAALFVLSRFVENSSDGVSKFRNRWHLAEVSTDALQMVFAVVLLVLTYLNVLSSYLFLLLTAVPFFSRYVLRLTPLSFHESPYFCLSIKCAAYAPLTLYMTELVSMVFEFFIPIMGRVGTTVPSDLVIGAMTGLSVILAMSLWFGVAFVVDRRHINLLILFLASAFSMYLAIIMLSPLGFAYDMTKPHPKPQRSILHHVNFIAYDADGNPAPEQSSSRLWYVPFDAFGKAALAPHVPELRGDAASLRRMPEGRSPLKAYDEEEAPIANTRPFWNMPYYFPIQSILSESYLLPEVPPFKPPFQVSLKLVEKRELHPGFTRVTVAIDPHDHMSVMLTPRPGYVLANWTAGDGKPKHSQYIPSVDEKVNGRSGYFIFYGFGRKPTNDWKLTFDVLRLNSGVDDGGSSEGRVIIDVSVNPHFLHGEGRETSEMRKILDKMPEWAFFFSWCAEQHLLAV